MDAHSFLQGECYFCAQTATSYICEACLADLTVAADDRCPVCAEPAIESRIYGRCLGQAPAYDTTTVLCDYAYPFDRYLQAMKFNARPELLTAPSNLLARNLGSRRTALPELLIPVPLHTGRQRQRGFNQAAWLANRIGGLLHLPVNEEVFIRTRATRPRSELNLKQRQKNMRKEFLQTRPITETWRFAMTSPPPETR